MSVCPLHGKGCLYWATHPRPTSAPKPRTYCPSCGHEVLGHVAHVDKDGAPAWGCTSVFCQCQEGRP